ncbi:hypothetical protein A3D84_02825 [Candidatus Woesebacteria bacterium RIFCSPHIGHO2_02_FULL_42_20]|uniref:Hedgehog/Intein (Hint) domain-containing protein n=1 Tax=Candidatus Woesebacteria bacterium RIFCSPHIGHO2_12_FULL_41_24 TaxID=1802510 RepID=A0A1F8AR26_9BACT|nr:MAG: hypothetical protein A2W15_03015 [Candidatus Woesebacteria bacterium RBG_16_41_13]OGM29071.1 MAG: hypothetical protein A2873_01865 [Candidatus Woesebacteria bacterium RIFCSPHIGHO2_01_FULL_42_80]OGM34778.1 MAG: hypothetical protein A3D84_02825 [Candidatus Woesebacteria bacterium RIFCSPHIGHO2_02_FULL_42_20]OGM53635.1 MAG: hypothetical protein A3E44_02020 [Candidatus Woesebacteria bacterium RIFCSPHIGHO2_12_FULL_41_24]OGM66725.1 MAG: hypothetical protein A2969_05155 [Candidatus Woesebacteri
MENQTNIGDQNTQQIGQNQTSNLTASSRRRKINPWMFSAMILFAVLLFGGFYTFYTLNKKIDKLTLGKNETEDIVTGKLRVKFKPNADIKIASDQLSLMDLQLPSDVLKIKTTLFATPSRIGGQLYGRKLSTDSKILNVDYTYTDEQLGKYKERIREDTAYLWVTFRTPLSWFEEDEWLHANYPDLVDVAKKQIGSSTVEIAVVNIESGQESFGNRTNPWYEALSTELNVPSGKETDFQNKLKTLDLFESVELIQRYRGGPGPICLDSQAKISTPQGEVLIKDVVIGTPVWTTNDTGEPVAGTVQQVSHSLVPADFRIAHILLADGKELSASSGHPLGDGRLVGQIKDSDYIAGVKVIKVESKLYNQHYTYDILPSGGTGEYWANGILLKSTLKSY